MNTHIAIMPAIIGTNSVLIPNNKELSTNFTITAKTKKIPGVAPKPKTAAVFE
jgi:hypothetical protein